jgi:alkyl sulfatase BDS1-like metallo-beta-lactamase superfamily hydrolase
MNFFQLSRLTILTTLFCLTQSCVDKPTQKLTVASKSASSKSLHDHCKEFIGDPHVEKISDNVFVAIGFDLANTILIKTTAGNVVIDAGISPKTSSKTREALAKFAPGRTHTLIMTHSHIDHVGGASAWVDGKTDIWATDKFPAHFLKQYSVFQPVEALRAKRQYGFDISHDLVPCTGIGPTPNISAAINSGARLPTKTFSGIKKLEIGGVAIELQEAPGETHDQLLVWLPKQKILMPGDNFYRAFPNLYTIRGTSPRPVGQWIESLDLMRRLEPEIVLPSHTKPVLGSTEVQTALRQYRDGIQWVYSSTVRGTNQELPIEQIIKNAALPPELANSPYLKEYYGQVDWSVRGILSSNLGWFDGNAANLYALSPAEAAQQEIELMGGYKKVLRTASKANKKGEYQWAVHLLNKLRLAEPDHKRSKTTDEQLSLAYQELGESQANSNGRAYLLQSAHEILNGQEDPLQPNPDEGILDSIPLETFMKRMSYRIKPDADRALNESVVIHFTDTGTKYFVTIRNGIAEIALNKPFPGSAEPIAEMRVTSKTWRQVALKKISPVKAIATGEIEIDGKISYANFMRNFQL